MDEEEVEAPVQLVAPAAVELRQALEPSPRWSRRSAAARGRSRPRWSASGAGCRAPRAGRCCRRTRTPMNCWSSGSSSVAGGLSRSSLSLIIMLHTSMRNPATPRSHQKRTISSNSRRTSSFHQLRSGCGRLEVVQEVLPARLVELPGRTAEDAHPVVGRAPVGLGVRPHVVVAVRRVATAAARRRTTGAGRWCGSAPGP